MSAPSEPPQTHDAERVEHVSRPLPNGWVRHVGMFRRDREVSYCVEYQKGGVSVRAHSCGVDLEIAHWGPLLRRGGLGVDARDIAAVLRVADVQHRNLARHPSSPLGELHDGDELLRWLDAE